MPTNTSFYSGTLGGTLLSIVPFIDPNEVYRTIALAFIGAIVSFGVSYILKMLFRKKGKD